MKKVTDTDPDPAGLKSEDLTGSSSLPQWGFFLDDCTYLLIFTLELDWVICRNGKLRHFKSMEIQGKISSRSTICILFWGTQCDLYDVSDKNADCRVVQGHNHFAEIWAGSLSV